LGGCTRTSMVSRSLEKMMLIAIGLTTVVIIGVPVLIFTMDTLSNVSQLEAAQTFADRIHNYTARVDTGAQVSIAVEINVPSYVDLSSSGNTLSIAFVKAGTQEVVWSETYLHAIIVVPPDEPGIYTLTIALVGADIQITFN
ncbi:MAG: hypothetical protein ACFFDR_14125, partial [Candidatus Thorarchaeota archaeon]